jgi:hypothetical protein
MDSVDSIHSLPLVGSTVTSSTISISLLGGDFRSQVSSSTSKSGDSKRLGDCDSDLFTGGPTSVLCNDWGTDEADTDFFELPGGVFSSVAFSFIAEHITRLSRVHVC